jgi:outer membrane protein assembly factor BamB
MKRTLKFLSIACVCLYSIILLGGCNKLFDGGGHYTLSGTLIDSCGGQRVPGRPLVVIYSQMTYPHPVTNKVVGRGQADASGYFRIRCEHVNSGNITLIDTLTGRKYFGMPSPPSDDTERSLGFVYTDHGTYKATVKLKIIGTFAANDTLYFGDASGEYRYYYPVISGSTYTEVINKIATNGGIYKRIRSGLWWDIGFDAFKRTYQSVPVAFNICEYPDTTTSVTINRP